MSQMTAESGHRLRFVTEGTFSQPVDGINEEGDLQIYSISYDAEDVENTYIVCEICKRLGDDELADHGISQDWQVAW